MAFSGLPSNGSGAAPNSLVLCPDPPPDPDPVAMVDVVWGGTVVVTGGTMGVCVHLGGGMTALVGGSTGGSTKDVAVGVGRNDWDVC